MDNVVLALMIGAGAFACLFLLSRRARGWVGKFGVILIILLGIALVIGLVGR